MSNPEVAVLMPVSDELGVTINRSINNLAQRMGERPNIGWSLHIGVNGTNAGEEVAKIGTLVEANREQLGGIPVSIVKTLEPGKELTMNALAKDASNLKPGVRKMHIGTDLKVYRNPESLSRLVEDFSKPFYEDSNPKYLGATILPYPIEEYKKYFTLSPEQRLFYTLLEIDKDPVVLNLFPKSHLRGGLYITGEWHSLPEDVSDDFSISRRARKEYGSDAIRISKRSVGYVIPRQSFADYFAVRFKRTRPNLDRLERDHPGLVGLEKTSMPKAEYDKRMVYLEDKYPEKYALLQTKQIMDGYTEVLTRNIENASSIIDQMQEELPLPYDYVFSHMSLDFIQELANSDPEIAAKTIICHYRAIVESLAVDPNSVSYGPREERYRGMLPLD